MRINPASLNLKIQQDQIQLSFGDDRPFTVRAMELRFDPKKEGGNFIGMTVENENNEPDPETNASVRLACHLDPLRYYLKFAHLTTYIEKAAA